MPVSQIAVPSPAQIKAGLFPNGQKNAPILPAVWQARVLLTPPGGSTAAGAPVDELFAGILTYDASGATLLLRAQLYGLESLKYYDLLFRSENAGSLVWALTSDPANPEAAPTGYGAPALSDVMVPARDAVSSQFAHAGSWKSVGVLSDAFSGSRTAQASTWIWCNAQTQALRRIMSVTPSNDFGWAILGSFYFVDFVTIDAMANSDLPALSAEAPNPPPSPPLSLKTFPQLAAALYGGALRGAVCAFADVQRVLPGLMPATSAPPAPTWTNTVRSQCYMIGQDSYPYYCQLWYDWNKGCQVTVFVQKGDDGEYDSRNDEFLPKGKTGPAIVYQWSGAQWVTACSQKDGGDVPMPVPDFVSAAHGRCRAVFKNSAYFGDLSIWTVALGDQASWADFWYWFDSSQKGVVFSLDPASSLTLIDYQTFDQNVAIDPNTFDDPTPTIPACGANNLMALTRRPKFKPPIPNDH